MYLTKCTPKSSHAYTGSSKTEHSSSTYGSLRIQDKFCLTPLFRVTLLMYEYSCPK